MTDVIIPIVQDGNGDHIACTVCVALVTADGKPVIGFDAAALATEYQDIALTDTPLTVALTPQADIALPGGEATYYRIAIAAAHRTEVYLVQVPDSASVDLVDLVGASSIDPGDIVTLGTAAAEDVGTGAGDVVQLDGSAKLPAVDGSQLTGLPSGVSDHGALTGLADDDHTHYHTNARGDARYSALGHGHTLSNISDAGTAAAEDVGTGAGDVVQLDGSAKLPAVDGSQLTGLAAALAAVVDDTTPQLGGDLDVNGHAIVSDSDGDIEITPDGTGEIVVGNADGAAFVSPVSDAVGSVAYTFDTESAQSIGNLVEIKNNGNDAVEIEDDGTISSHGAFKSVQPSVGNTVEFKALGSNNYPRCGFIISDTNNSFANAALWVSVEGASHRATTLEALTNADGSDNDTKRVGLRADTDEVVIYGARGIGNDSDVPMKLMPDGLSGDVSIWLDNDGNVSIGDQAPAERLDVDGGILNRALSADPDDPANGQCVRWLSDGTDSGDAGDWMMKITVSGVTKTTTLVDYSAL